MLTPEQERVLSAYADSLLQEEADTAKREADIKANADKQALIDVKLADLKAQYDLAVEAVIADPTVEITMPSVQTVEAKPMLP